MKMPKFTVDSINYNTEDLSEYGQKIYESLQFTLMQLGKLENEIEIYKIAHKALSDEFRSAINK